MSPITGQAGAARASRRGLTDRGTPRAFSLLELIVSMSVLVILVGILLPGLNRAARAGARLQCLVNLNHLYDSLLNYLVDSNDVLPIASYNPLRNLVSQEPLDRTLAAYGGGSRILWICPEDHRMVQIREMTGSYLYPPAQVQVRGLRTYLSSLQDLDARFPIFVDIRPFHLAAPPASLDNAPSVPSGPRGGTIFTTFGPGHNQVLFDGSTAPVTAPSTTRELPSR